MIRRLCLGIVFVICFTANAHAEMVSIAPPKVNMRSGPGENYAILWEIGRGYPLKVIARKGNWLKVADFENDVGWVYKKLVSREAHLIVKKERVNIRSGPGEKYRLVGKANYGVVLKTVKRGKGWVRVRHENGLTGWVLRDLLWGW
ncbi:SH3 domain-containing protein [Thiovibrio sp. JS02]